MSRRKKLDNINNNINKVRLKTKLLVEWRFKRQLSQRKAAERLGVAEATYRKAEGGGLIQGLTGARISGHLRIPFDQLRELK